MAPTSGFTYSAPFVQTRGQQLARHLRCTQVQAHATSRTEEARIPHCVHVALKHDVRLYGQAGHVHALRDHHEATDHAAMFRRPGVVRAHQKARGVSRLQMTSEQRKGPRRLFGFSQEHRQHSAASQFCHDTARMRADGEGEASLRHVARSDRKLPHECFLNSISRALPSAAATCLLAAVISCVSLARRPALS